MTATRTMLTAAMLVAAPASAWDGNPVDPGSALRPRIENAAEVRDLEVTGSLLDTLHEAGAAVRGPFWAAWEVPATAALRDACCFDGRSRQAVCRLESSGQSWGTARRETSRSGRLVVLARWADGRVERTRGVSDGCGLDLGGLPLVRLSRVSPDESVALLAGIVERQAGHGDDDGAALAALAYHAADGAGATLRRLAARGRPTEGREQALFWLGQARGEEGARFLAEVTRSDPSPEIRSKAVFSLSQSGAPSAGPAIVAVATHDRDAEVRSESLFWLAQSDYDRAAQVLIERLDADPDREVRHQAVFAISQLQREQALPLLIRIARERRDPELRREAIFWLGQSEDPRAMDFLTGVLQQ